ncbi:MAG: SEC-C metal-binding domain-containing protein, partial [Silvibacterium sp.]
APVPLPHRNAAPETTIDSIEREFQRKKQRELEHARMAGGGEEGRQVAQRRTGDKVGRNDPCPCGSGKKYKKCHGAAAEEN